MLVNMNFHLLPSRACALILSALPALTFSAEVPGVLTTQAVCVPDFLSTSLIILTRSSAPTQHFDCPNLPPPIGIPRAIWPSLYRFCVSPSAHCDCHVADPAGHPNVYSPICHENGRADPNDLYLELAIHDCVTSCMCYGGPQAPTVPATGSQNGNGRPSVPGLRWGPQPVA